MNVIGSVISRLTALVNAPARLATTGLSQLNRINPLRLFGPFWRQFKSAPQRLVTPLRPLLKKLGISVGDSKSEKRSARDDLRDMFTKDSERKARKAVAQVARVSQIHMVAADEQRFIVHIGNGAGRAATQLHLLVDGLALDLHFAPADPPDLRAPIRLTSVTGKAEVRVNDIVPKFPFPVRQGDTFTINGQPHRVELFYFDRTPVVTRVDASYATNTGPYREANQDAIAIGQHPRAYLFAVADGVGAGQDGDEISAFASKYLLTAFFRNASYDLPWIDVLTTAFKHINAEVRAWVRRSPNPAGTTLTAVVIRNWSAFVTHVGDSRLYLFRQNVLQQLTQDHMQQQPVELATVQAVNMTDAPPKRDVLTRAIGKVDGIEPQTLTIPLNPGDKLLITSDGLTNTVRSNELITYLAGNTTYAAEMMVRRALELEAKDNVTAIVVECLADAYLDDIWEAHASDRVFTRASRTGSLKMRKPGDPVTQVASSPIGCFTFLLLVALLATSYWILTR